MTSSDLVKKLLAASAIPDPDQDEDFTPEIARKTVRLLKETIAEAVTELEKLHRLAEHRGNRISALEDRVRNLSDQVDGHDERVTELLEANNRYLQEARDARAQLKRAS